MLSPELLKKVESIFIRSRRRVTDVFTGEYESAYRGRGIEFEEFREYVAGDDVRQIDWNVTARFDKPYVKVFREEREQTIFLIVDASQSLFVGRERLKQEVIAEVASLLAYVAMKSHDKIGLIIFSDVIETFISPKKGKAHVWSVIAAILSHKPKSVGTNIKEALRFFLNVSMRKSICFLISDLMAEGYEDSLRVASLKHEVTVLRVLDESEKNLPRAALTDFVDVETRARFCLDLNQKNQWFAANHAQRDSVLKSFLGRNRVDFLDLGVRGDTVSTLLKFFIQREKKR